MNGKIKSILPYPWLFLLVILTTMVVWLPFLLKAKYWFGLNIPSSNFQYLEKNYDGPLYIIVAKTWYKPQEISKLSLELNLSPSYFAAHLPFYPLMIKGFSFVFGYLKAMIFTNLFFTILLAGFFYFLLNKFNLTKKPLLLTAVFLFLPRFLVVRSIGAPESLFLLLILLSLFFFEKQKYLWAGLFGGLAALTKTPGILLFPAYLLTLGESVIRFRRSRIERSLRSWIELFWKKISLIGIFLIPLSLLGVFCLYTLRYGNFWAYFNSSSFVPLVFPYSVFNFQKIWVGTAWLEEIIFYFFLYLLTIINLRKMKSRSFYFFSLVFFSATTFVQHRDISRYSLPLWPLACLAFEKFFTSKKFLIALLIILPAIYLYAWNFIVYNILPISNWQPFL